MLNRTDDIAELDDIALGKIPLFARLSRKQHVSVKRFIRGSYFDAGEVVLPEGARIGDRIFIVAEGEVSVCKTGVSPLTHETVEYELEVRGKGEVFGAMSVIDGKPLGVTVRARTPVTIAVLNLKSHRRNAMIGKIRNILIAELRLSLSDYVRNAIEQRADSLRLEAEFSRYRNSVGSIVIAALSLLSVYTLTLGLMPRVEHYLGVNFALSPFIIVLFAAIFLPIIAKSKFPPAFFGLRLDNWRSALTVSVVGSMAVIAASALIKWLVIEASPAMAGTPVITSPELRLGGPQALTVSSPIYWLVILLYLMLTPVQEFVARCGVQAPLYAFLHGPEWERRMWSILVSSLVFSAAHAHISLAFALAAFIPGLFWGWIFARTNSLLAASASHFLIGGAGVFLFDMQTFFEKLF